MDWYFSQALTANFRTNVVHMDTYKLQWGFTYIYTYVLTYVYDYTAVY